jgi:hypothetical protein
LKTDAGTSLHDFDFIRRSIGLNETMKSLARTKTSRPAGVFARRTDPALHRTHTEVIISSCDRIEGHPDFHCGLSGVNRLPTTLDLVEGDGRAASDREWW